MVPAMLPPCTGTLTGQPGCLPDRLGGRDHRSNDVLGRCEPVGGLTSFYIDERQPRPTFQVNRAGFHGSPYPWRWSGAAIDLSRDGRDRDRSPSRRCSSFYSTRRSGDTERRRSARAGSFASDRWRTSGSRERPHESRFEHLAGAREVCETVIFRAPPCPSLRRRLLTLGREREGDSFVP